MFIMFIDLVKYINTFTQEQNRTLSLKEPLQCAVFDNENNIVKGYCFIEGRHVSSIHSQVVFGEDCYDAFDDYYIECDWHSKSDDGDGGETDGLGRVIISMPGNTFTCVFFSSEITKECITNITHGFVLDLSSLIEHHAVTD